MLASVCFRESYLVSIVRTVKNVSACCSLVGGLVPEWVNPSLSCNLNDFLWAVLLCCCRLYVHTCTVLASKRTLS